MIQGLLTQKGYRLICASASPRRQALLKGLDIEFEVQVREIDESYPTELKREHIPMYVADRKADAFHPDEMPPGTVIMTADTIVWLKDEHLGKPESPHEAFEIIRALSGSVHTVYTGVCLRTATHRSTFFEATDVYFKPLSDDEINYYIETYKPYDKAGAYGIQEWIGYMGISRVDGCYYNVMGLPVNRVYDKLKRLLIDDDQNDKKTVDTGNQ